MKPKVKQKLIAFIEEKIKFNEQGKSIGISLCWGNMFHPDKSRYSVDAIISEIYMKEHGLDWELDTWEHYDQKRSRFLCMGHSHGMPKQVMQWAGIGFIDHIFFGIDEKRKEEIIEKINTL